MINKPLGICTWNFHKANLGDNFTAGIFLSLCFKSDSLNVSALSWKIGLSFNAHHFNFQGFWRFSVCTTILLKVKQIILILEATKIYAFFIRTFILAANHAQTSYGAFKKWLSIFGNFNTDKNRPVTFAFKNVRFFNMLFAALHGFLFPTKRTKLPLTELGQQSQ